MSYGPELDVFIIDMRPYRDTNSAGTSAFARVLGEAQAHWLVDEVSAATATWKVIASDMPLGLVVSDGDDIEAVADGLPGEPRGREAELDEVLRGLHHRGRGTWCG